MRSGIKLNDIAARISTHLKAMEADPKINRPYAGKMKLRPFYEAGAYAAGRYVQVCYVSYQGWTALTKVQALAYLAWLDAGNKGKHWRIEEEASGR